MSSGGSARTQGDSTNLQPFSQNTNIDDVRNDPAFGSWGRLLFPVDEGYMSGSTLGSMNLAWYSCIDPSKTVEICNYFYQKASSGQQVFYDIYSDQEKADDPAKQDTGLFFFRGDAGNPFAVWSAGGGFAYVAAMHDSFPHALELSKRGYNAFAVIYRPGAQTACEDLSRAISFIWDHADELGVQTDGYLLGGGSAGARMSAWVGGYGTASFGQRDLPQPAAVVTQYTGLSDWLQTDPPTYANVGSSDGIANWRVMQARLGQMSAAGIPTEFHVYDGLRHGFGLGAGTVADGWLDQAVSFWEANR
ncbi:MAG: alpha/beta hydrolase [Atopobiaceae bacterium]